MKNTKKIITIVLMIIVAITFLLILTGCDNNVTNEGTKNSRTSQNSSAKKIDHKIYKYVKMSGYNTSTLLYSTNSLFNDPSTVSSGNIYYKPCIIAEFDTETGKAKNAKLYMFFLDGEDEQYVKAAMEKYNSSTSEYKKNYTNIQKGRVNDNVTYLTADLKIDSYIYTQFIDSYIIKSQDIEKYKDEIYYSRLYNYSSNPPHEEGSNYFEETLEGIRIEWADSEISGLTGTKNMEDV